MAEKYKFQKAKPSGVEAGASKCPDPSVHAAPASPQSAGLTGAKMMKETPVSPKAMKRYQSKGVGRL
jgi:hypothetical protein